VAKFKSLVGTLNAHGISLLNIHCLWPAAGCVLETVQGTRHRYYIHW